mmetsp:Transcript_6802/g.12467  ORF Transcript_6802/g.12467 Transcript_6802/m.12467 type:complete len:264 (-) Transcript_6802:478-1269(-)
MCHLVLKVLPEPHSLRVDSDCDHELERSSNEVCKSRVCYDALIHSILQLHQHGFLHVAHLHISREDEHFEVGDLVKLRVVLEVRVHKVLDLSLSEFSDTQDPLLGANLVPEALAKLGRRKRELHSVVVEETGEVHEDALGCLGTKVAFHVSFRTNGRRKHQVERKRIADVVVGIWRLAAILLQLLPELLGRELVYSSKDVLYVLPHASLERVPLHLFQLRLKQVVSSEALAVLQILHHEVREPFDVPARLEDGFWGHGGPLDL